MSRFFDWTPNDSPGVVYDTTDASGWEELRERYTPERSNLPFERIIEIARSLGVRRVLSEYRYIDRDYRNEHSRFYSTTYRRYPSVCHRLHFFAGDLDDDLSNLADLQDEYCGYSVMRPLMSAPVGRTMLRPPPELRDATLCLAEDRANLFGVPLTIEAAPFTSQDAQYMRCAHSAQWMALYHAHLRHRLPRRLPSDIHEAALGGVVQGRQLPSEGLTVHQILNGLDALGMSPGLLTLPETRAASKNAGRHLSLFAILCRYVNSQMPPIVTSESHAWVIVGYAVDGDSLEHDNIVLYRNDDARGPYLPVKDPWNELEEDHTPWSLAITTLPEKVYMTGERAEQLGAEWLTGGAQGVPDLRDAFNDGRVTFRTYAILSNQFKKELLSRGVPKELDAFYRFLNLPRYVWIIEAIDRTLHDAGQPAVLGEVVIDSTAHHLARFEDPALLAMHVGDRAGAVTPDHEETRHLQLASFQPYESGCSAARI